MSNSQISLLADKPDASDSFLASAVDLRLQDSVPSQTLKSAFDVFNQLSSQLTDSYTLLENRVADLTRELQHESEKRLLELKQKEIVASRLERLINFLPAGVVVIDTEGYITESNPIAEQLLQVNLSGRLWREVINECFSPKDDDGHEVSNLKGQRISITTCCLEEDGQIILLTDLTETRQLQSQLSRHERLSALGKMVSTLAHQVRTPLSSAILYGSHLLNEPLSPEQQNIFTQRLMNRLYDIDRQVQDMLLFIKPDIVISDEISIGDIQQGLMEMIEMPLQRHDICCSWKVSGEHKQVLCNRDALQGALLNLVNNSLEAMASGGKLTVDIRVKANSRVIFSVSDTGSGIPQEIINDVQELFFTTRSQGTGIGLAVVKSVAESHGGCFKLTPLSGNKGTCACLDLPILK